MLTKTPSNASKNIHIKLLKQKPQKFSYFASGYKETISRCERAGKVKVKPPFFDIIKRLLQTARCFVILSESRSKQCNCTEIYLEEDIKMSKHG